MALKEDQIQQQIISYLSFYARKCNFVFFAPLSEGTMTAMTRLKASGKDKAIMKAYMSKMGFLDGVSDILIMKDGRIYCMELKTATGKQSKNQILFQENCLKTGVPYEVVRSLDGCVNKMRLWGIIGV